MKILKPEQIAFVGGLIGSYIYFKESESTQPKNSNCSYLAPISTDLLAIGAGAIVAQKGIVLKVPVLSFVGAAILGIHFFQFNHFKKKTSNE